MLKIGIMLPQEWERSQIDPVAAYEKMTRVAQEADALGFASIWLIEHLQSYSSSQPAERILFETWTSTAALARDTRRIRIGQLVTCNSFRHPALLAKMASTVDVLSHGRLNIGLGAGWYEQEYVAYGYPFPDAATRLRQLKEALQIMKAMWTENEASFEGKYYHIRGAINQPKGVQQPHIPLLIGGRGEQVTLKLVARYADACNFTHPDPEEMKRKFGLVQQYCEDIGRDYNEVRRTVYVNGCFGETDSEARTSFQKSQSRFSLDHIRLRGLLGSPETIRQRLRAYEIAGVQEIVVAVQDATQLKPLHLLHQAWSDRGSADH